MRANITMALFLCAGCQGTTPDGASPDAAREALPDGAVTDATTDAGSGAESGDALLPQALSSGVYSCSEPQIVAEPFPALLSSLGGVCSWATISGFYALNASGTVTYNGMEVATWTGTSSAFIVTVPAASTSANDDSYVITCTLSASAGTACSGDAGTSSSGGDDGGEPPDANATTDDSGGSGADDGGVAGAYPSPADGGAVTWDTWVRGFSGFYCESCHNPNAACGGAACHTPSNPALYPLVFDMDEKSSWTERAATIQCGIVATQPPGSKCSVAPETFPKMDPGVPLPSDEERVLVADWIDAGCP
jgi:hypothetical protein